MLALNLGCGDKIYEDYKGHAIVNVDKFNTKAQVRADACQLPFRSGSFDYVALIHVLEHISWRKHIQLLEELHRVLREGGMLAIGAPNFEACAKAFLEDRRKERWSWWLQTLYGSQDTPGQFHTAPVTQEHLTEQLFEVGFGSLEWHYAEHDFCVQALKKKPLPWF